MSRKFTPPVISRYAMRDYLERERAEWDFLKQVPPEELKQELYAQGYRFATSPRDCQLVCTTIGLTVNNFLYLLDMGAGKSKLLLDLFRFKKKKQLVQKGLICVPEIIHMYSWEDQIKEHAPDLRYALLQGTRTARDKMIEDPKVDIIVTTYMGLQTYMTFIDKEEHKRVIYPSSAKRFVKNFQFVGLDEIHRLGNQDSLSYRMCLRLRKACEYVYGTTGSPFGRDLKMLFSQFKVIDLGETLGETMGFYRAVFFNAVEKEFRGTEYTFKEEMLPQLQRIMKHRSIRYSDAELTDLPPLVHTKVKIHLTAEGLGYYNRVLNKLKEERGDYHSLKAPFIRMRQIASGFLSLQADDDSRIKVRFKENPKLDALRQFILDLPPNKKLLVFYNFNPSGELIAELLQEMKIKYAVLKGGMKRAVVKADYQKFLNDKRCKVYLLNNRVGSTAINPQKVCNYAFVYERPVSVIEWQQLVKRLHRPGQTKTTYIYDAVVVGTAEEDIVQYHKEGKDLKLAVLDRKVDI